MEVSWSRYIQHIYYIGNEYTNDIKDYFKELNFNINSITYIPYKIDKNFSQLANFKKEATIRALKDAYINRYFNVLILSDDICFDKFSDINSVLSNISGDMYVINPEDICEDCIIYNRKAINYINNLQIDYTNKNWYKIYTDAITKNLITKKAFISICHHKIDYVITYVNPNDINWKNMHAKIAKCTNNKYDAENRYREWNLLPYIFRSIEKNLPYINNIYLVVWEKSQIPTWLNTDNIKIITHKEIIPERFLPTFNSCTIEMFLPFIKGLSEYWIYGNDDMFNIDTIDKRSIFNNGKCVLPLQNIPNANTIYFKQCINSFKLAMKDFTKEYINEIKLIDSKYKKLLHCIHPYLKSTGLHLHKLYSKDIYNSITMYREDKNYNQYIYAIYEYLSNNFENQKLKQAYADIYYDIKDNYVIPANCSFICFNDTLKNNDEFEAKQKIINTNLYTKLYTKSKYEINDIVSSNIYNLPEHNKEKFIQEYKVNKEYIPGMISVIMSVYNCEDFICKTIESILAQTYTNFELIIINDGSTDNTLSKIKLYTDERIKVISKRNSGVSDSRNIGINVSRGEYITFIDGDDWIKPIRFEHCIETFKHYDIKIVQNQAEVYVNDDTLNNTWEWPAGVYNIKDNKILSTNKYDIGQSWSKVFDARLIKENSIYFPYCDMAEDTLFAIQAYTIAQNLIIIPERLSCYRREVNNTLSTKRFSNERKFDLILATNEINDKLEKYPQYKYFKNIAFNFMINVAKNMYRNHNK